jgi:hypothetical protein
VSFGDFYVMFQRENHFIYKRLQKPRRLNLKCMPAVNSVLLKQTEVGTVTATEFHQSL